MCISQGSCVNRLAEVELSGGSVKAFHDLEEALWLVQEELAEEQSAHIPPHSKINFFSFQQ